MTRLAQVKTELAAERQHRSMLELALYDLALHKEVATKRFKAEGSHFTLRLTRVKSDPVIISVEETSTGHGHVEVNTLDEFLRYIENRRPGDVRNRYLEALTQFKVIAYRVNEPVAPPKSDGAPVTPGCER